MEDRERLEGLHVVPDVKKVVGVASIDDLVEEVGLARGAIIGFIVLVIVIVVFVGARARWSRGGRGAGGVEGLVLVLIEVAVDVGGVGKKHGRPLVKHPGVVASGVAGRSGSGAVVVGPCDGAPGARPIRRPHGGGRWEEGSGLPELDPADELGVAAIVDLVYDAEGGGEEGDDGRSPTTMGEGSGAAFFSSHPVGRSSQTFGNRGEESRSGILLKPSGGGKDGARKGSSCSSSKEEEGSGTIWLRSGLSLLQHGRRRAGSQGTRSLGFCRDRTRKRGREKRWTEFKKDPRL